MDILIIADFSGSFDGKTNNRFIYLANMLAEGNSVEIVTSNFWHGKKRYFENTEFNYPYKVTMLHEEKYTKNVSLKRFYSHYMWGRRVKKYLKSRKKPDVIYCAIPTLYASNKAAKYCEKKGIRFVIDIQDLWPEAFKMVLRIPVVSDVIFAPFTFLANGIYKRADDVVAVSKTYVDRALRVSKKCKEGHSVFLGTNLATFDENARNNPVEKPEGAKWLAYCGTLGASYDIRCAIDALKIVSEKGMTPPTFMVMGDGPRKAEFEAYAKDKGVDAVFTGRLPYDEMCGRLCACDITVNPITRGAAQSIINKHADYASSGLPVLNTQECPEYCDLVDAYKMGYNCKNNDAEDLADKLITLLQDEELCKEMGRNSRRCAEERFNRANSYKEIEDVILAK